MEAIHLGWFLLILPLTAAGAILVHLHRKPDMAIFASIGVAALMLLIAVLAAVRIIPAPVPWDWLQLPGFTITFRLRLEPTGLLLLVTSTNLLIQLYAIDELRMHPARGRFFGYLSFLSFVITGVITVDSLLALLFFWPLLSVAFYLLLAFPENRPAPLARALRLFLIQSFADLGLVAALLILWVISGGLNLNAFNAGVFASGHFRAAHASELLLIGLGLVLAAAGKAALIPLHRWLTGLRSGPIVVLALVPSFGLIAALDLINRSQSVSALAASCDRLVFCLSLLTFLIGALLACRARNIYALLACLALSQSGAQMFVRDNNGLAYLLLILLVGLVLRTDPGNRSLSHLTGKLRGSRLLSFALLVAAAALAGIPPFRLFLVAGWGRNHYLDTFVTIVSLAATFLNGFALMRLVTKLVFAKPLLQKRLKEHPKLDVAPLLRPIFVLLTIGVLLDGLTYWWGLIHSMMFLLNSGVFGAYPTVLRWLVAELSGSLLVAALGIFLAYFWNRRMISPKAAPTWARSLRRSTSRSYRSLQQLGRDAITSISFAEAWIFNGLVLAGSTYLLLGLGELLRLTQTGHLRAYLWFVTLAALGFGAYLVLA